MSVHKHVLGAGACLALTFGSTIASAQKNSDCEVEVTPLTPPPGGDLGTGLPDDAPWVRRFSDSIGAAELTANDQSIPFDNRLRTFPLKGDEQAGVTINALIVEPGEQDQRKEVYIPNPVLVVTWVGSHPSDPCPILGGVNCGLPTFQDYRMFQEYRANSEDSNLNMWFATTCNAGTFIEEVLQIDRSCMNPDLGADACNLAITLGLQSVGVPYAFGPMANSAGAWDPYGSGVDGNTFNLWWQADLMIAVCDRSALIRPSLNPTVAPDSPGRPTANGKPIWNGQKYRQPEPGDAIYPAVMEKLNGTSKDPFGPKEFVGYINQCDHNLPPVEFRGADGYWRWLDYWRANSWYGPHEPSLTDPPTMNNLCSGSQDGAPYNLFPFSGIGLSLNYNLELEGVIPPPEEFYSVSEFIHVGEQPIYVIGVYQGAQLLGGGLPGSGQVPWYESCNSDFNMDGVVNGQDLTLLLAQWNTIPGDIPNMCLNRDKLQPVVGQSALMELLEDWGSCPGWPKSLQALDPACR